MKYGLTLRYMAEALSISSPYLSSIELGDRKLTKEISDATIRFFSSRITKKELSELQDACDKTLDAIPVSMLRGEERNLVAAFARRLSDGHGIPSEIKKWLQGDEPDDPTKRKH